MDTGEKQRFEEAMEHLEKIVQRLESGDLPLGASVSLVMVPILGVFAAFILRGVRQRAREL